MLTDPLHKIPSATDTALPLLKAIGDGGGRKLRDLIAQLAGEFELTDEQLAERVPSDTDFLFANRVAFGAMFLKRAALISQPQRGHYQITEDGRKLLAAAPKKIDTKFLMTIPAYAEAIKKRKQKEQQEGLSSSAPPVPDNLPAATDDGTSSQLEMPPEEAMDEAYKSHRNDIETKLLEQIMLAGHRYFEKVVVDLLLAMGYGGSRRNAGRAFQTSGDGGVDGVIDEDRLALDRIYIQAKCNAEDNAVGVDRLQAFAGALRGKRASKGVFVTTSYFTKGAREYAQDHGNIALIDGEKLVALMVDHNIGVMAATTYELKRLDGDYFQEAN